MNERNLRALLFFIEYIKLLLGSPFFINSLFLYYEQIDTIEFLKYFLRLIIDDTKRWCDNWQEGMKRYLCSESCFSRQFSGDFKKKFFSFLLLRYFLCRSKPVWKFSRIVYNNLMDSIKWKRIFWLWSWRRDDENSLSLLDGICQANL